MVAAIPASWPARISRAAIVAAIDNSLEFIDAADFFRSASDVGELCSI